jgi:hypothetical protein
MGLEGLTMTFFWVALVTAIVMIGRSDGGGAETH